MGAANVMLDINELPTDPSGVKDLVVQRALDTSRLEALLQQLSKGLLAERLSSTSAAMAADSTR